MTDRLIVFSNSDYTWTDPWGKPHTQTCLKVRAILRPESDPSITRFPFVADNGYEKWEEYGYNVPGIGEVRHMSNRVSYHGGSWWLVKSDMARVIRVHDKGSVGYEHAPMLDMWGNPTTRERLFP